MVFIALQASTTPVCCAPVLSTGSAHAKPMRIMSMNQCTDLLLLQMVPKSRIVSVSYLAHVAVQSVIPGADAGVSINYGTAEDIINDKPDLILVGDFTTMTTRKLAARALHTPIIGVKPADSFEDIRTSLRQIGAAVSEPARAEALIAHMDATLADLKTSPAPRPIRVVAWNGGDAVPGKKTLTNAIIEAAGGVNIAAQPGAHYGSFDVEQLIFAHPDALLYAARRGGAPSLRADEGQHRLVRELYRDRRIDYDDTSHQCGLPQSADSARELRRALLALPKKGPPL